MKKRLVFCTLILGILFLPLTLSAEELDFTFLDAELPNHVQSIEDQNTFFNRQKDQEFPDPQPVVETLINSTDVEIENPSLIELLNETKFNSSRLTFGYSSEVYLGQWPLAYHPDDTSVNWQYQKINSNTLDNLQGNRDLRLHYDQLEEMHVQGGLQNQVESTDQVMDMILSRVNNDIDLPLGYRAVFGKNTRKNTDFTVEKSKVGKLDAYAAAVNAQGKVTYGQVYLRSSGRKQELIVKNVTEQFVKAWIPVQDYITFSFSDE